MSRNTPIRASSGWAPSVSSRIKSVVLASLIAATLLPDAALGRAQVLTRHYPAPTLLQLERHDDALTVLAAAARLRPQEPSVLYAQALTLTRLERFREALKHLLERLRIA